jgi:hypothetical protein
VQFHGPEANIADAVQKLSAGNHGGAPGASADAAPGAMPAWQQALANVHLPLYDVHWERAVILRSGKRGDEALRVGLTDGRNLPLTTRGLVPRRSLNAYDVVYVRVIEGKSDEAGSNDDRTRATAAQAQLRVRPTVQGSALVLENKTGRILAMAGSFSRGLVISPDPYFVNSPLLSWNRPMYDPVRCFGLKSDSIFATVLIKPKSKPNASDARLISSRGVPIGTPLRDSNTTSAGFLAGGSSP